ncbi:MOP flippase family protein [Marinobacterium mangrovicola]|uniref:PST family polysaccharide transporter n=1 Tax=Marinobacterium mangrovicola TaxID=1476959 RepID=A0A4R1GGG3_9GAMM|nr:MOP flippase family protein [Marinobacterium mangrovicola]TCK07128.1 PST family polysaccharide transporter [Marinobacterium mangrovicola]
MSLRKKSLSATRWTTLSATFRAVIQLAQIAVLARILAPEDFGLMAMAGVVLTTFGLFSDLGLSSALMHYPRPERCKLSTLFWLDFFSGCVMSIIFLLLACPLSILYDQPNLFLILCSLSVIFPISALGRQFRVLSEKDLCFKPVVQNEIVSLIFAFIFACFSAKLNLGVYSLVVFQLAAATINTVLAWGRLSKGVMPTLTFDFGGVKPYVKFGIHRIGDGFWNSLRMQADIFVAGVFLQPSALAFYSLPRDQTLKIASSVINPVITRVGLPVMTKVKNNPESLKYIYLKILRVTSSFNFPIYAFIALFSDEMIYLLLGEQWTDSAFYLEIFALWGLLRSVGNPAGSLIYAVGMAKRAHQWNLIIFILTCPLCFLSVKLGGLNLLAWTMLYWQAALVILAWKFIIYPACQVGFIKYIFSIFIPLILTLIASLITDAVSGLFNGMVKVFFGFIVFSVTYSIISWIFNKDIFFMMKDIIFPKK